MRHRWHHTLAGLAVTTALTLTGISQVTAAGATPTTPAGQGSEATDTTLTTTSTSRPEPRARLRMLCGRVPNLIIRTQNAIDRLEDEVDVVGSLAWLQARIDRARDAGREELVTVLENRLEVRTARLDLLKLRHDALEEIDEICDAHGA